MKRFKIEHSRSGHHYRPEYRDTVAGAVKCARSMGWWKLGDSDIGSPPLAAFISERVLGDWEIVAKVTEAGVTPVCSFDRQSVKRDQQRIAELTARVEAAEALRGEFAAIVDPVEVAQ